MLIKNRFSGSHCKVCRKTIKQGDLVSWVKGIKGVTCHHCYNNNAQGNHGTTRVVPDMPKDKVNTTPVVTQTPKNNTWKYHFTLEQMEKVIQVLPEHSKRSSRINDRGYEWDFNVGFNGAMNLLREGYKEGYLKAKPIIDKLVAKVLGLLEITEVFYDVTGTEIDVAQCVQGVPECVQYTENRQLDSKGNQLITVTVNTAISASVSAQTIFDRGIKVLALTELLEHAGHKVKLKIVYAVNVSGKIIELYVTVKDFTERINKYKLAFILSHPAYYRRLYFALLESLPVSELKANGWLDYYGYGMPIDLQNTDNLNEVYFPVMCSATGTTENEIARFEQELIEELQKHGVGFKQKRSN